MRIHKYLIMGVLAFVSSKLNAQLIQTYGFGGAAGSEVTLPPNGQPTNGQLSNIKRGSGITASNGANAFTATGFTTATSPDTADYFEFGIRPNAGFTLKIDSVVVSERRSNTGVTAFAVRSSVDGYSANLGTFVVPDDNLFRHNQKVVPGAAFQNLGSTSTTSFRYYGYAAEAEGGTWRLDSIRIYGTISQGGGSTNPTVSLATTNQTVVEGGNFALIVNLSAPATQNLNLRLVQKSGNLSAADYSAINVVLPDFTIQTGQQNTQIFINALSDFLTEGTETAVFALRGNGSQVVIGTDSILNLSVTDVPSTTGGVPFTRTIAQVRGANTDGQADSVGRNVRLFGTVHGLNQRISNNAGYQLFLRDATGGIGIFKTTNLANITSLTEGDSVKVMGKIEVFRGLSQINPDSMVILATGRPTKTPTLVTTLSENTEADLVRLDNVSLVSAAAWTGTGSGFTVQVTDGTNITDVRIDNDCPLYSQPAPTGTFSIIGMGSQFASTTTAPFAGGYQLIPRKAADLITTVTPGPKPVLKFSNPGITITEGVSTQSVPFEISVGTTTTIQVRIFLKDGTASAGSDYDGIQSVSTIFEAGSALNNAFPVNFLDDAVAEPTETLQFVIRKGGFPTDTAYTIGADSIFTITINDNDVAAPTGPPFTRTIEQVRGANTDGQADSVGRNVRLFGTVHGLNQRIGNGAGYQLFLRDATGGIGIFKTTNLANITSLSEGDSVKVMGKIEVFRGLSQINPDSMVILATGRPTKTPTVVTTLSENTEADLVRLDNVSLVSAAAWTGTGSGFTVQVTDGTNITDVRIDNDCPLYSQPAPTGTFSIIGMGSQFASTTTAPFAGGYQLIPRKAADLITSGGPVTKPTLRFASPGISFTEATGSQSAGIVLSGSPSVSVTVQFVVKGGTASAGTDYEAFAFVGTGFNPASSNLTASLPVNFLDDAVAESTETLQVVLRKPGFVSDTAYEIGADSIFTFTITDNDGATPSGPPFTRTIEQVRGANTDGQADSVGRNVRLFGTVHGLNQRIGNGAGYQLFLRDATGGIGIFKTTNLANITSLSEGDSVKVMGKIEVFRGLSQINPDSMVILATGRPTKTPTLVTSLSENTEADLVRLNNVSLVSAAAWTGTGSGFTVQVTDGTNITDVRIDNDCPLYSQPAPTGTFSIIGMGSQFASTTTAPFAGGYQLIPRRTSDLIPAITPGPKPVLKFTNPAVTITEGLLNQTVAFELSGNPATTVQVRIYPKGGTTTAGTDHEIISEISSVFEPNGVLASGFTINVFDDQVVEPTENVQFVIRKGGFPTDTAYVIGADSIFTLTINDNDVAAPTGPPFTRTIAQVRGANTDGQADSVGRNVRLFGTVHGLNQRIGNGAGYQLFLRDATGGIGIFKTTNLANITSLTEGDSVKVMGKIEVFRGLSQINPDSMVILATGRPTKTPTVVTGLSENTEADLVRINNVSLVSAAAWTGTGTGFTVQVTDGTNITDVRIDNDCPLYSQPAPTGTFDIIGMGSQFASSTTAPFTGGYQLIPRRTSDLIPAGTPTGASAAFAIASQSVAESNDTVRVNVTLSEASTSAKTVRIFVKGGTATSGSDYEALASSLVTFPANSLSQQVKIKLIDDAETEGAETIQLVLRKDAGADAALLGNDSLHTITINANDGSTQEPFPPTRTIGLIRGANTQGQADSVGKNVRIFGTVYGLNQRIGNGAGYQMFVRDATGGIGIFKTTSLANVPTLVEGDSVKIMGKIEVFRGLSQINPDSMVILATGRPIKTPTVVTELTENTEADLVRLNNLTLVSAAAWTGTGTGFTVQVTDGTNTFDVRIDNDCPLYSQPAPTGSFALIGMGSQFAGTTAPFTTGYQLVPRYLGDLIPDVAVEPICKCKSELVASPNPGTTQLVLGTKEASGFEYRIFNAQGQLVHSVRNAQASEVVNTQAWPTGVYTIKVSETGKTLRWVKF